MPKGSVDDGNGPAKRRSAKPRRKPACGAWSRGSRLGRYLRVKGNRRCRVDVYLMRVTKVLEQLARGQVPDDDAGCVSPTPRPVCGEELQQFVRHRTRGRTGLLTWRAATASSAAAPNRYSSSGARCLRNPLREACRRSCRRDIVRLRRRRFTVLDTFDGRVRRAGARLTRDSVQRRIRGRLAALRRRQPCGRTG